MDRGPPCASSPTHQGGRVGCPKEFWFHCLIYSTVRENWHEYWCSIIDVTFIYWYIKEFIIPNQNKYIIFKEENTLNQSYKELRLALLFHRNSLSRSPAGSLHGDSFLKQYFLYLWPNYFLILCYSLYLIHHNLCLFHHTTIIQYTHSNCFIVILTYHCHDCHYQNY